MMFALLVFLSALSRCLCLAPFTPATFSPPPYLTNQHVQTLTGALLRPPPSLPPSTRSRFSTPDGDSFDVDIIKLPPSSFSPSSSSSSSPPPSPSHVLVALHGLESTSSSPLSQSLASSFLTNSPVTEVHTLCFRGCSGEPNQTAGGYHLGFTDDLYQVRTPLPNP
jgi:predicted alpha/beta-fold hydrolase